jgi:hypothetical protein
LDAVGRQWLLSDELDVAVDALRTSDFAVAGRCCTAAAIDPDCGTVAYVHAMAELGAANAALQTIDLSNLTAAQRHLELANQFVATVRAAPTLTAHGNRLATRIAADLTEVKQLKRLMTCLTRFRDFKNRYERRIVGSRVELQAARSDLASIRVEAVACQRTTDQAQRRAGRSTPLCSRSTTPCEFCRAINNRGCNTNGVSAVVCYRD